MPDMQKHVHCGECFAAIATEEIAEDGTVRLLPFHIGKQTYVRPAPNGFGIGERPVPVCDECDERIHAEEARSKILLPVPVMPSRLVT